MPIWFLALNAICICFVIWRGIKNDGFYFAGEKVDKHVVVIAIAIIVAAFGLMLAMELGFISDFAY
jgi:hypothetical protein